MACYLNLSEMIFINAKKYPHAIALKEITRSFTYKELNTRVNKLATRLLSAGLKKGDKFAVFLENNIEIVELYLAAAKSGLIIVPINIRLIGEEIEHIVNNSDSKLIIVNEDLIDVILSIRSKLKNIKDDGFIVAGKTQKGFLGYNEFIGNASENEPGIQVNPKDPWILLYTSGTTGKPKGVMRSHESYIAFFLINAVDFGFNEHDVCLNVMPLSHVNSTFFSFTFLYIGGTVYLHPARLFNAANVLEIIEKEKITFISLIPTHYTLLLFALKGDNKYDVRSIRKLLCSSAPVRKTMKKEIMHYFPNVQLYEGYGSTEAGIVTILKPEDQMRKLGSIGYESLGTNIIRILDENGKEVGNNCVGELYSRGPMLFDSYYKLPEKTKESFKDGFFSAKDMAIRDDDGFYYIVDRKDNMIITGGEHVYPSEVEEIIGGYPGVFDVAVIGLPHDKWGECVSAVIIPEKGLEKEALIDYCKKKLAGFKVPKKIIFIKPDEMPRTATLKIIHRKLRERYEEKIHD